MGISLKKLTVLFSLSFILLGVKNVYAGWGIEEEKGFSTCALVNPPHSSVEWRFTGNQTVYITLENGNVLGVIAFLTFDFGGISETKVYELLPFASSQEEPYSNFRAVPVPWCFNLSAVGDAALVYGHARWAVPLE